MLPTTLEALLVISLFALPGFVFTTLSRRSVAYAWDTTDLRLILTVLSSGAIIQLVVFVVGIIVQPLVSLGFGVDAAITSWLSTGSVDVLRYFRCAALLPSELPIQNQQACELLLNNAGPIAFWTLLACLIVPAVAGAAWGRFLIWPRLGRLFDYMGVGYIDRTPTAWDYVAQEQYGVYVVVRLKDGQGTIAGVYGSESFGSLDPKRPDIYLQEEWLADDDGNVRRKVRNTSGVWIAHDSIESIRFLQGKEPSDEPPDIRPDRKGDARRLEIHQPPRSRLHRSVPSPQHRTRYRKARYSAKNRSQPAAAAAYATRVVRTAWRLIRQSRTAGDG